MKNKDKSRKWMWWFLGVVLAMQLYFVRELLAAFTLFVLGFAAITFVIVALYMLHQGWAVAVEKLAVSEHPAMLYLKRRVNLIEDFPAVAPSRRLREPKNWPSAPFAPVQLPPDRFWFEFVGRNHRLDRTPAD